jgi:hypothetical protein
MHSRGSLRHLQVIPHVRIPGNADPSQILDPLILVAQHRAYRPKRAAMCVVIT